VYQGVKCKGDKGLIVKEREEMVVYQLLMTYSLFLGNVDPRFFGLLSASFPLEDNISRL
jgi:hypothetical protein